MPQQQPEPELDELYRELILDHNRRPRNFRVIEPASVSQDGYNPLCGDRLTLYLSIADGTITEEQAEKLRERVEEYGPLSVIRGFPYHRPCKAAIFLGEAAATVLGTIRALAARRARL